MRTRPGILFSNSIVNKSFTGLGNILKVAPNTNSEAIYDEVDKLLYKSKKTGRNKITVKDIII